MVGDGSFVTVRGAIDELRYQKVTLNTIVEDVMDKISVCVYCKPTVDDFLRHMIVKCR